MLERLAGRPLRTSPVYAWHAERGASFGEKSGWERVNYYESNAAAGDESTAPDGWPGLAWSPATMAEHVATRTAAGLFDETSFAKIAVRGPDAARFLERVCDNHVARGVGQLTYTQALNPRGGIEADFTVTRIADDRFWVITGTAFGNHDLAWLRKQARLGGVRRQPRRHHRPVRRASRCGGPPRATSSASLTPTRRLRRGVPVHDLAGDHRRRRARCGRCASPSPASTAGSSTPAPSTARACGRPGRGRRAARAAGLRLPSAREPAARDGLPGVEHRPDARDQPVRGGARLLRQARQARRLHRRRRAARRPRRPA